MKIFVTIMTGIFALLFIYLLVTAKNRSEHLGKLILGCLFFPGIFAALFAWDTLTELSIKDYFTFKRITQEAQIDAEEIKRIKERGAAQSATIELVAKKAIDVENLYHDLVHKNDLADERLKVLATKQKKVSDTLEALIDEQRFLSLVYRVETFDTNAFSDILNIAYKKEKFSAYAERVVSLMKRRLELDRVSTITMHLAEVKGKYRYEGPFTTDEIAEFLKGDKVEPTANLIRRHHLKLFISTLVELLKNEKDLLTANRITYTISRMTGETFYPWNIKELEEWWEKHQQEYPAWPYEDYQVGMSHYRAGDYKAALDNFQKVLTVDSGADKSRAVAVACAVELADLALTKSLVEAFKEPNGRWARWAKAKITLLSDVATGTVMLVDLSVEFPTFVERAISRDSHVLQQVNWNLYDTLMKERTRR